MNPSQLSKIHKRIMSDYFFCQDYSYHIAKLTMEYYKQLLLLYGRYKKDPNIKAIQDQADWYAELEKEGIEW